MGLSKTASSVEISAIVAYVLLGLGRVPFRFGIESAVLDLRLLVPSCQASTNGNNRISSRKAVSGFLSADAWQMHV